MYELFLALCALTSLSCGDINVQYHRLDFDTYAVAAMDIRGDYHIFVDSSVRKRKGSFKRNLLVHELSHLIVYTIDPTNDTHNEVFDDVCEDLAKKAGVSPKNACAASSRLHRSHWMKRTPHYRRD